MHAASPPRSLELVRVRACLLLVVIGALALLLAHAPRPAQAATPGTWVPTGSMADARETHTATLLPNGLVLVAGGFGNASIRNSAELYNPSTGTWALTGSMADARELHTATLLPDGRVLVAGGFGSSGNSLASAEIYTPSTGAWTLTGPMKMARASHTATLLPNGLVLVTGGSPSPFAGSSLDTAELYNPATGTWALTGTMHQPRSFHTATLLPNGLVLVAGGLSASLGGGSLNAAELYDPSTGAWTPTGSMADARELHTATLLPNGLVLVAGGATSAGSGSQATAEIYTPSTGTWTPTGSMTTARTGHTATLLPNGLVLAAGGEDSPGTFVASADLYNPSTSIWTPTGSMTAARAGYPATLLPNGQVLVAGGLGNGSVSIAAAELYTPAAARLTVTVPPLSTTPGTSFSGTVATFTDPGCPNAPAIPYSATISWGDGTTSAGTVIGSCATGLSVTGTHTYATAGNYTVTITVSGSNGATGSGTATATVSAATPAPTPAPAPTPQPVQVTVIAVLTVQVQGCGTTTPGTSAVVPIQNVVVTAHPCANSVFTGWTGGTCDGETYNPCDVTVAMNETITAHFRP